ncbi:hypothetical protein EDB19DRAFT_1837036 [Suillus lakei]|nr:hypothetical protein EDB19DRAFT_1837036 [Suillus lakei]
MAGKRQARVSYRGVSRKRRRTITEANEVAKHASMLTGRAKTRLLAATRYGPAKQRTAFMLQKTAAHICHYWSKTAPTFRIPSAKIGQLAKRSKPSKADKAHATKVMYEMADWESDAFSAKFVDIDGNLLAAYFSNRLITTEKPLEATYIGSPQTPSQLHRSVHDLKNAQADNTVRLAFDGIPSDIVEDALYASQVLHHFLLAYPDDFKIYQKAFDAGVWEVADPGPWLGRAIVWKLNVLPHRDGLDGGPTAIFCLGHFSGGEAYLTDLKLKLQYRPGDVLIFRAGDLYHAVGPWKAEGGITARGITPGRVGNEGWLDEKHSWRHLANF